MEVITIESETFKRLEAMFETAMKTVHALSKENKSLKQTPTYSVEEVAEILKCTPQTVLLKKREFDIVPTGKSIIFLKSSVDKYLERKTIRAKK
jgi:hypothetical protein